MDNFCGDAAPDQGYDSPTDLPIDCKENLEDKFVSGVNRTDCPRMWGYSQPLSGRKLISGGGQETQTFELVDALTSWKRLGGEVLYDDHGSGGE